MFTQFVRFSRKNRSHNFEKIFRRPTGRYSFRFLFYHLFFENRSYCCCFGMFQIFVSKFITINYISYTGDWWGIAHQMQRKCIKSICTMVTNKKRKRIVEYQDRLLLKVVPFTTIYFGPNSKLSASLISIQLNKSLIFCERITFGYKDMAGLFPYLTADFKHTN